MSRRDDETVIPTLTDVACPGEILRAKGLWLPLAPAPKQEDRFSDWQARLPDALQAVADGLLEETRRRAHAAADAALSATRVPADGTRRR